MVSPVLGSVGSVVSPVLGSVGSVVSPVLGSVDSVVSPVLGSVDSVVSPVLGSVDSVVSPELGFVDSVADWVSPVCVVASVCVGGVVGSEEHLHKITTAAAISATAMQITAISRLFIFTAFPPLLVFSAPYRRESYGTGIGALHGNFRFP